jgi:hypothetical protein
MLTDGSACESKGLTHNKEQRDQTRAGVISLLTSHRSSPSDRPNSAGSGDDNKHNLFQLLNAAKMSAQVPVDHSINAGLRTPISAPLVQSYIPSPDLQLAHELFGLTSAQFADPFQQAPFGQFDDGSWSHLAFSQNPWLYASSFPVS